LTIALQAFITNGYSQNAKVTIQMKNAKIESILKEIEKQTEYRFVYDTNIIKDSDVADVSWNSKMVSDALTEMFSKRGIDYRLDDKQLALFPANTRSVAQRATRYTISGYMKDSQSAESLISATVYNKINLAGTSTNQYGFYSLTLPAGNVEIVYSYVGYNTQVRSFHLNRDTVIYINLEGAVLLQEVVVTADRVSRIQESTQMSSVNVPMAQIKSMPAFLGEVDVLKIMQLMPGIQSGGEGTSGLYVRGGGPDQNLILLDGVPMYNVSHLFGFFSVFNADAVNNMEIIKGGFPARYGGRVSSVLDISLKEGNMKEFHGEGAVGIISAKLTLEGPIVKDRTSFIVSGRRTYIDALAAPFFIVTNTKDKKEKIGYYFYDLTAKINHRISANDRIYLSAYMGDDKFSLKTDSKYKFYDGEYQGKSKADASLKWGNATAAFRWNHIFTPQLFGNTMLTYSRYRFNIGNEYEEHNTDFDYREDPPKKVAKYIYYNTQYLSGIHDWSGKIAFDYLPSPNHYIRFGAGAIYHTFNPCVVAMRDSEQKLDMAASKHYSWEYAAYAEDDIRLTGRLKTNIGLHWSAFSVGSEFYRVLQPRASVRYLITPLLSAKASYSRMAQYVHLLSNSSVGMPTDLWVPTTELLRPQTSDQVAVGIAKNFREEYEISVEAYYKTLSHVIEYKEGASFFNMDDSWEHKILQGDGQSYGVELFAQKKTGSFTGWVGYTLAWTDRQFDLLNNGKRFPYKYDRRHDISIALMKRLYKKMEISGAWVFGTGNAVTVPVGLYYVEHPITKEEEKPRFEGWSQNTNMVYEYGERNGYRMRAYHRLDLSISFIKEKKWGERRWVISVFNAYNRKNPFFMDVREQYIESGNAKQYKFIQQSLFPIIPSISYNFKF
jgi:outer membrane cobalamin receptor